MWAIWTLSASPMSCGPHRSLACECSIKKQLVICPHCVGLGCRGSGRKVPRSLTAPLLRGAQGAGPRLGLPRASPGLEDGVCDQVSWAGGPDTAHSGPRS